MNNPRLNDILLQAEKVSSLIATARDLMNDGKNVDLSNLETKIKELCLAAQSDDLAQPNVVQGALKAIVEDLNKLDEDVTSRHGDAGGQSLESSIKRAIDAYDHDNNES